MIDTHTHIYSEEFDEDRDAVVERALAAGVSRLLLPNIDEASVSKMMSLCKQYPDVCFPMIGLHPTDIPEDATSALNSMRLLLDDPNSSFIAIGEVGIDLYWDTTRKDEQIRVFKQQIEWSIAYGLPLVIHSRSSHAEIMQTLLPYSEILVGGIFHCFGGTVDEAKELLENFPKFVLGIGGVLTFKKSTLPNVLKAAVPLTRIVLETDAPYLAPTPHRGKRNEPAYLTLVVQKLAEIYETTIEEVIQQTTQNAYSVFTKLADK